MQFEQSPFEVEIRFSFSSYDEACSRIPFLNACLEKKKPWKSTIYGESIFQSGRLLRIGIIFPDSNPAYYFCFKGPDTGTFANIRQEVEEDITRGINNSSILEYLGGKTEAASPDEIVSELERLGHGKFMSFEGKDTYGEYEPYHLNVKLMECPILKLPLLVEFEKIAGTAGEAKRFEIDLREITDRMELHDCRVREEPPTLLYATLSGNRND